MHITEATHDDIPELAELLGILFTQESDFNPDAARQREGLSRIIAAPVTGRVLVWREHGRARGMVNLLFTISTALGANVAILEDMIVHPDYRNKRIGSQLITAAIDWCKTNGFHRISLLTDATNDSAQRFYTRHGFRASEVIVMRLHL
ncbi:MAG: GNAT family N-acetyltransferase [Candidatus Hydrogenedentes bacterium]|nr:GNAT family N-acetyltransferase [Candidatus Hydrogenedentota bacterium]